MLRKTIKSLIAVMLLLLALVAAIAAMNLVLEDSVDNAPSAIFLNGLLAAAVAAAAVWGAGALLGWWRYWRT